LTAAKSKPKCKFLNKKKHSPIRVAFVIMYSTQDNNEMLVEK